MTAVGLGRGWARLVERKRARKRSRRYRKMRSKRSRVTWQTCRLCGSGSFLPTGADRVCGGCLSLQ